MTAVAVRSVGSIQPVRAKVVPAEPTNNTNELGRLMADIQGDDHKAVVAVLSYRMTEVETEVKAVGAKVDALGTKIDAAQSERTAALQRRPWYAEPVLYFALLSAALIVVIGIKVLGPENTSKAMDHIPTAHTGG